MARFRAHRRQCQRGNDLRRRAYRAWLAENPQAVALADQILVTDVALKLLLVWVVVMIGALVYPAVPDAGVVIMASVPVTLWLYRRVADQRERDTVAAAIGTGISMPEQLKLLSGLSGLAPGTNPIRPRVDDETTPAGNAGCHHSGAMRRPRRSSRELRALRAKDSEGNARSARQP